MSVCAACGNDESRYGCTSRDVGEFCRAPRVPRRGFYRAVDKMLARTTREVVVTVPFPPSAPRGPCALCGAEVVIAPLPTGRSIAVDPTTHEPHDARCPKR